MFHGPIKFASEDLTKTNGSNEYRRMQHIVHQAYKADMAERAQGDTPGDWIRVDKVDNATHKASKTLGNATGAGGGRTKKPPPTPAGGTTPPAAAVITAGAAQNEDMDEHVSTTFSQYAALVKDNKTAREAMAKRGIRMQSTSMSLAATAAILCPEPKADKSN